MTADVARRIAREITRDYGLSPPLTGLQVEAVIKPHRAPALPPLRAYEDGLAASLESRILQEAEGA